MQTLAVLSSAGVHRDLLYDARQLGALGDIRQAREMATAEVDRALAQLAERSLLTFSLDGQTVLMHRLVMRIVRDGLTQQGRLTIVDRPELLQLPQASRKVARPSSAAARGRAGQASG